MPSAHLSGHGKGSNGEFGMDSVFCTEKALVIDHVAMFGARCAERPQVVDQVRGFDAFSAQSLAHVAGFDAESASRGPW
jgi:hypothetical protein